MIFILSGMLSVPFLMLLEFIALSVLCRPIERKSNEVVPLAVRAELWCNDDDKVEESVTSSLLMMLQDISLHRNLLMENGRTLFDEMWGFSATEIGILNAFNDDIADSIDLEFANLRAKLRHVHMQTGTELKRLQDDSVTDSERQDSIFTLFQQDLLGHKQDEGFSRDPTVPITRAMWALGLFVFVVLNTAFLFYGILFSIRIDSSSQMKAFVGWFAVEVCVISVCNLVFAQIVVPIWSTMRFQTTKQKLRGMLSNTIQLAREGSAEECREVLQRGEIFIRFSTSG